MHDASLSISAFLAAAAAKQPTPGGGAVAALAGALAASMGEMVLNYSVNKKDLQIHRPELESALSQLHRARQVLLALMVEDQEAYAALADAKKKGADAVAAAIVPSMAVPQAIGTSALAMLKICDQIIEKVNHYLLSDLAVCCDLAMTTIRCASYNIRVNLPDMPDETARKTYADSASELVKDGTDLIQKLSPRIWAKVEGAK